MPPDRPRPTQPHLTPEALAERAARQAREAAALRENLRRRKAQSRARAEAPPPAPAGVDADAPAAAPTEPPATPSTDTPAR